MNHWLRRLFGKGGRLRLNPHEKGGAIIRISREDWEASDKWEYKGGSSGYGWEEKTPGSPGATTGEEWKRLADELWEKGWLNEYK